MARLYSIDSNGNPARIESDFSEVAAVAVEGFANVAWNVRGDLYTGSIADPKNTAVHLGSGYTAGTSPGDFAIADDGAGLAIFAAKHNGSEVAVFRVELDGSGETQVWTTGVASSSSLGGNHVSVGGGHILCHAFQSFIRADFPGFANQATIESPSVTYRGMVIGGINLDEYARFGGSSVRRRALIGGASLELISVGGSNGGHVRWVPSRSQYLIKDVTLMRWWTPGSGLDASIYNSPETFDGGIDFDPDSGEAGLIYIAENDDETTPRLWTLKPDGSNKTLISNFPDGRTPSHIRLY